MRPYNGQSPPANNAGVAELDMTPPPGYTWEVYQIGITNNSSQQSTCSVFINQRFYCGSNIGNQDAADGSPLSVKFSDQLRIVWSNCSAGAIGNAYILVDESPVGQQSSGYPYAVR